MSKPGGENSKNNTIIRGKDRKFRLTIRGGVVNLTLYLKGFRFEPEAGTEAVRSQKFIIISNKPMRYGREGV
jgi:hypothetical protein